MKYDYFETEFISFEVHQNIFAKFLSKYKQDGLKDSYSHSLPVFVRWNNRNVYGLVFGNGNSYFVSNFYRIKRDGTPVRMIIDFCTDC